MMKMNERDYHRVSDFSRENKKISNSPGTFAGDVAT
jgi:hypothetical protein